eukprot:GILK01000468.1.p1 GENE.GILK01000468.1~~GILK01000468.1.p1  ORF type:complete len:383 (+),score=63.99 GILK01000468.1:49-1149(+)
MASTTARVTLFVVCAALMAVFVHGQAAEERFLQVASKAAAESAEPAREEYTNSCQTYRNCADCTGDSHCGWCAATGLCLEGNSLGPNQNMNMNCSATYWTFKECRTWSCDFYDNCYACMADPHCGWCDNIGVPEQLDDMVTRYMNRKKRNGQIAANILNSDNFKPSLSRCFAGNRDRPSEKSCASGWHHQDRVFDLVTPAGFDNSKCDVGTKWFANPKAGPNYHSSQNPGGVYPPSELTIKPIGSIDVGAPIGAYAAIRQASNERELELAKQAAMNQLNQNAASLSDEDVQQEKKNIEIEVAKRLQYLKTSGNGQNKSMNRIATNGASLGGGAGGSTGTGNGTGSASGSGSGSDSRPLNRMGTNGQ